MQEQPAGPGGIADGGAGEGEGDEFYAGGGTAELPPPLHSGQLASASWRALQDESGDPEEYERILEAERFGEAMRMRWRREEEEERRRNGAQGFLAGAGGFGGLPPRMAGVGGPRVGPGGPMGMGLPSGMGMQQGMGGFGPPHGGMMPFPGAFGGGGLPQRPLMRPPVPPLPPMPDEPPPDIPPPPDGAAEDAPLPPDDAPPPLPDDPPPEDDEEAAPPFMFEDAEPQQAYGGRTSAPPMGAGGPLNGGGGRGWALQPYEMGMAGMGVGMGMGGGGGMLPPPGMSLGQVPPGSLAQHIAAAAQRHHQQPFFPPPGQQQQQQQHPRGVPYAMGAVAISPRQGMRPSSAGGGGGGVGMPAGPGLPPPQMGSRGVGPPQQQPRGWQGPPPPVGDAASFPDGWLPQQWGPSPEPGQGPESDTSPPGYGNNAAWR